MTRVTILVCTLNGKDRLASLLPELEIQAVSRPEAEIVLVDNGSRDGTREWLAAFCSETRAAARTVIEPGPGKVRALNAGVRAALGEIVAFLDDDVAPGPSWLKNVLNAFDDPDLGGIGGRIVPAWEGAPPSWFTPAVAGFTPAHDLGGRDLVYCPPRFSPVGANMAFRKEVLERAGGFDPDLGHREGRPLGAEESDLAIRAARLNIRMEYRPGVSASHPFHRSSWSRRRMFRRAFYQGMGAGRLVKKHGVRTFLGAGGGAELPARPGRTPFYRLLKAAFAVGAALGTMGR